MLQKDTIPTRFPQNTLLELDEKSPLQLPYSEGAQELSAGSTVVSSEGGTTTSATAIENDSTVTSLNTWLPQNIENHPALYLQRKFQDVAPETVKKHFTTIHNLKTREDSTTKTLPISN